MPQLRFSYGAWIVLLVAMSIVGWFVLFAVAMSGAPAPCFFFALIVTVLVAPCLLVCLAAEAWPDESLPFCFAYSTVPLLAGFTTLFYFPSPLYFPSPQWEGIGLWPTAGVTTFWMCLFGRFLGRRAARRRHGLCPACAYPIGTSDVCTECGKPAKPLQQSALRIASRVMMVLLVAVAGVLAVDHLLFTYASLNTWRLVYRWPQPQDLQWWMDHVGPLPAKTPAHLIPGPPSMPGAAAPEWMWLLGIQRNAGAGSPGVDAEPYSTLPMELLVCAVDVGTPLLKGSVLSSTNEYAQRAGAAFPCVAVERSWISPHSSTIHPHPTSGGWTWELKPIGLMVNAIPFAVAIAGILWFSSTLIRRIRAKSRIAREQCSQCGYRLLKEQSRCPECGAAASK